MNELGKAYLQIAALKKELRRTREKLRYSKHSLERMKERDRERRATIRQLKAQLDHAMNELTKQKGG